MTASVSTSVWSVEKAAGYAASMNRSSDDDCGGWITFVFSCKDRNEQTQEHELVLYITGDVDTVKKQILDSLNMETRSSEI